MITAEPTPDRKPGSRRVMLLAAAAVAAVALLTSQVLTRGNTAEPAPGPAGNTGSNGTSQVRKDSADRMLLKAPGWKVDSFYGGGGFDGGELSFKSGKNYLQVHWYKAELYKSYYDDRTPVSPRKPIEILGQKGALVTYSESDYAAMLPPKGKYFLEIRGGAGPSEQAYRDLVAKLYAVDTDTFVDALPGTVIKPAEAEKVIDAMLSDIPVPSGLDREKLYSATPNAHYHVVADVTSAVSCNWIDKWIKAEKTGDKAGMKAAVDAMNTSRSWKALKDIEKEGGWSSAVWEVADALAAGKNPADYKSGIC